LTPPEDGCEGAGMVLPSCESGAFAVWPGFQDQTFVLQCCRPEWPRPLSGWRAV